MVATKHLNVPELAERLGVPQATVYRWNCEGHGPRYLKIGKHVRYRVSDVEAWEKVNEAQSGARSYVDGNDVA